MSLSERPSLGQFIAMMMIGTGFVALGIMLFLLLNKNAASAQDFSAVPAQVNFSPLS
ncbi:MAG: hypothetical protein IPL71_05385 [Anaerolineales bacterium]|uniref:hypothetical protein n=1 Tax=Candidatus Villigracilis proximus TaxID=3140683 RepID=UPI003137390F|nr:hypothetical protein [Anaerolineales bacterium]